MTIATGIAKQLVYKKEVTWNVAPSAGSAQRLRRVTSDLKLKKATFESNELISTYQRRDFRHGVRSVDGTISGELSAGTFKDFIASALRRLFTTITAVSGASITIGGTGPTYTVTRAAGSFLSDGFKAPSVVRLTAGAFNASNLNKNLVVVAVTATVLTVYVLNGSALVAEGPIGSATVTVPGKVSFVPQTGHIDESYSFEHFFSDLDETELFTGCKISECNWQFPPQGMGTIALPVMGANMTPLSAASAPYFTTPTVETTFGLSSIAGGGLIILNATANGVITGLNISLKGNYNAESVAGSFVYAGITPGRVLVDGQFTALFDSITTRDLFVNETTIPIAVVAPASPAAAADFMVVALPLAKLGSADKDDGDKSLVQTCSFTALENTAGGAGTSSEATTIWVQDSQA